MTGLRRSVLSLQLRDGAPEPWPPPDADAVPDAVILRAGAGAPVAPALQALAGWGVDCIADAPLDELPSAVQAPVASALCRDGFVERIRATEAVLGETERGLGLSAGAITIELFITTPRSFLELDELLAASERVVSVITDPPALPKAFGVEASSEVDQFAYPRGKIALAAAHRRVPAVGLFEPAGLHRTAAGGMDGARFSFAVGLHGGLCRTWAEVRACNRGFMPDEARVARARRIIEVLAEAGRQGLGAISLDGRMIDLPFIHAAETTLRLAEQATARSAAARQIFLTHG